MAKRIHFEDDIFYLNLLIRSYRDALELDLDAEMFLNRSMDDLGFIDAVFERLLDELTANERLIERGEQLRNLLEAEERYATGIGRALVGRGSLASAMAPFSERLSELRDRSSRRKDRINAESLSRPNPDDDPNLVSGFELNELLKDDDDL